MDQDKISKKERLSLQELNHKKTANYEEAETTLLKKWYPEIKENQYDDKQLTDFLRVNGTLLSCAQIKTFHQIFPEAKLSEIGLYFHDSRWINELTGGDALTNELDVTKGNLENIWLLSNAFVNVIDNNDEKKINEIIHILQPENCEYKELNIWSRRLGGEYHKPSFETFLKHTKGTKGHKMPQGVLAFTKLNPAEKDKSINFDLDEKETSLVMNKANELLSKINANIDLLTLKYFDFKNRKNGQNVTNLFEDTMVQAEQEVNKTYPQSLIDAQTNTADKQKLLQEKKEEIRKNAVQKAQKYLEKYDKDETESIHLDVRKRYFNQFLRKRLYNFFQERKPELAKTINTNEYEIDFRFRQSFSYPLTKEQRELANNPSQTDLFFGRLERGENPNIKDFGASIKDNIVNGNTTITGAYTPNLIKIGSPKSGKKAGEKGRMVPECRLFFQDFERFIRSNPGVPFPEWMCEGYVKFIEGGRHQQIHEKGIQYIREQGLSDKIKSILSVASGPHEELRAYGQLLEKKEITALPEIYSLDFSPLMHQASRAQMKQKGLNIADCCTEYDIVGDARNFDLEKKDFDLIECSSWGDIAKYDKNENETVKQVWQRILDHLRVGGILKFSSYEMYSPEFIDILKNKLDLQILMYNQQHELSDKTDSKDLQQMGRVAFYAIKRRHISREEFEKETKNIRVYRDTRLYKEYIRRIRKLEKKKDYDGLRVLFFELFSLLSAAYDLNNLHDVMEFNKMVQYIDKVLKKPSVGDAIVETPVLIETNTDGLYDDYAGIKGTIDHDDHIPAKGDDHQPNATVEFTPENMGNIDNQEDFVPVFIMWAFDPQKYLDGVHITNDRFRLVLNSLAGKLTAAMCRELYVIYTNDKNLHQFLPEFYEIVKQTNRPELVIEANILNIIDPNSTLYSEILHMMSDNIDVYLPQLLSDCDADERNIMALWQKIDWNDENSIRALENFIFNNFNSAQFAKYKQLIFSRLTGKKLDLPVEMRFGNDSQYYFDFSKEAPATEKDFSQRELESILDRCEWDQQKAVFEKIIASLKNNYNQLLMEKLLKFLSRNHVLIKDDIARNWDQLSRLLRNLQDKSVTDVRKKEQILQLLAEYETNDEQKQLLLNELGNLQYEKIIRELEKHFLASGQKIDEASIKKILDRHILKFDTEGELIAKNHQLIEWIVTNLKSTTLSAGTKRTQLNNQIVEIVEKYYPDVYSNYLILKNKYYKSSQEGKIKLVEDMTAILESMEVNHPKYNEIIVGLLNFKIEKQDIDPNNGQMIKKYFYSAVKLINETETDEGVNQILGEKMNNLIDLLATKINNNHLLLDDQNVFEFVRHKASAKCQKIIFDWMKGKIEKGQDWQQIFGDLKPSCHHLDDLVKNLYDYFKTEDQKNSAQPDSAKNPTINYINEIKKLMQTLYLDMEKQYTKTGAKIDMNEISNRLARYTSYQEFNEWVGKNIHGSTYAESSLSKLQKLQNIIVDVMISDLPSVTLEQKEELVLNKLYIDNVNGRYLKALEYAKILKWADKFSNEEKINDYIRSIRFNIYHTQNDAYYTAIYNSNRYVRYMEMTIEKYNFSAKLVGKMYSQFKLTDEDYYLFVLKNPEILESEDVGNIFANSFSKYHFQEYIRDHALKKYTNDQLRLICKYSPASADELLGTCDLKKLPAEEKIELARMLIEQQIKGGNFDKFLDKLPKKTRNEIWYKGHIANNGPELIEKIKDLAKDQSEVVEIINCLHKEKLDQIIHNLEAFDPSIRGQIANICWTKSHIYWQNLHQLIEKGYLKFDDETILKRTINDNQFRKLVEDWIDNRDKLDKTLEYVDKESVSIILNKSAEFDQKDQTEVALKLIDKNLLSEKDFSSLLGQNIISLDKANVIKYAFDHQFTDTITSWMDCPEKIVKSLKYVNEDTAKIILDKITDEEELFAAEIIDKLEDKGLINKKNLEKVFNLRSDLLNHNQFFEKAIKYQISDLVFGAWADGDVTKCRKFIENKYPTQAPQKIQQINAVLNNAMLIGEFITNDFRAGNYKDELVDSTIYSVIRRHIQTEDKAKKLLKMNHQNATDLFIKTLSNFDAASKVNLIEEFIRETDKNSNDIQHEQLQKFLVEEVANNPEILSNILIYIYVLKSNICRHELMNRITKPEEVKVILDTTLNSFTAKIAINKLNLLSDQEQIIYFKKIADILPFDDLGIVEVLIDKPSLLEHLENDNMSKLFMSYLKPKPSQYKKVVIDLFAKNAGKSLAILAKYPDAKDVIFDALPHFATKEEQIEVLEKLLVVDNQLPCNKIITELLTANPQALRKPNILRYAIRANEKIVFDHVLNNNYKFIFDTEDWLIESRWKQDKKRYVYHVKHLNNDKAYIFLINGSNAAEFMSDEEQANFEILVEKSNNGDWPVARLRYKFELPGAKIKPTSFAWRRDANNNDKIIGIDVNFPVRGFIPLNQLTSQIKTELGLNTKNEQDNDFMYDMKDNLGNFIRKVELVRFNGQNRWVMNIVE